MWFSLTVKMHLLAPAPFHSLVSLLPEIRMRLNDKDADLHGAGPGALTRATQARACGSQRQAGAGSRVPRE